MLEELKEVIKDENCKGDERRLKYKITEGQLFVEGLIAENDRPKSIDVQLYAVSILKDVNVIRKVKSINVK